MTAATVWLVYVDDLGGAPDRICNTLATAKAVGEDYLVELEPSRRIIEPWQRASAPTSRTELWVRYYDDHRRARPLEQRIVEKRVNTTGRWFE